MFLKFENITKGLEEKFQGKLKLNWQRIKSTKYAMNLKYIKRSLKLYCNTKRD